METVKPGHDWNEGNFDIEKWRDFGETEMKIGPRRCETERIQV